MSRSKPPRRTRDMRLPGAAPEPARLRARPDASTRPASPAEVGILVLGLVALTFVLLVLPRGAVLFTRPLWVDECITVLVASHRSPLDVIGDLRSGADGGASLFHLMMWGVGAVAGSLSPVLMRSVALISVWAALGLLYVLLRRRFGRDASIAGVLATGSHSLVIGHAFDARFYGLWLLCCVFFAGSFSLAHHRSRVTAIAAILLVTSHWYGIIALALMSGAVLASHGSRWRDGLKAVAPAAAGIVAFAAISPLAAGQHSALTVATWIPISGVDRLGDLARLYWIAPVPLLGAIAWGAAIVRGSGSKRAPWAESRGAARDPGVVALASLALVPLALAIVSRLGQPSLLARYALPAALAWAPLVALAFQLLGRWPARVMAAVLALLWFQDFQVEVRIKRSFEAGVRQWAGALSRGEEMELPIVFQSQHVMYPLLAAKLGKGSNAVFLDVPDSTLDALFPPGTEFYDRNKGIRVERDLARVHATRYGFPRLVSQAALDSLPRFLLVSPRAQLPVGIRDVTALGRVEFPNHPQVSLVQEDLLLFERE